MQTFIYGMLGLPFVFALLAISGFVNNRVLHILNRITATIVGGIFVSKIVTTSKPERSAGEPNSKSLKIFNGCIALIKKI